MSQLPDQRELLALPEGTTHLITHMDWELPEPMQPDPWVFAYPAANCRGAIDGQHAHASYRKTSGGVITLERNGSQTTAVVNLAALEAHCPEAGGVSFVANLYFGPQSQVTFATLVKAGVQIAAAQSGQAWPIAGHDVNPCTVRLNTFHLPLASIMREDNGGWSLVPDWAPRINRF